MQYLHLSPLIDYLKMKKYSGLPGLSYYSRSVFPVGYLQLTKQADIIS